MSNNRSRNRNNGGQHRSGNPAVRSSNPFDEAPEVVKLETGANPQEKKYVTLFSIDGTDYDVWINPSASLGLKYIKFIRQKGQEAAAQFLLESMLGEEGYDALMNFEELLDEQFEAIFKQVEKLALGAKEAGKRGNR